MQNGDWRIKVSEITKKEKNELVADFTKQAKILAIKAAMKDGMSEEDAKRSSYDFCYWFSSSKVTCVYNGWNKHAPREYNIHRKEKVVYLKHFLPENCSEVCMDSGILAECIATIREGNNYRFFYCQHEVGRCPHKFNDLR